MTVSNKQLKANKQNAKRGGVKTEKGKKISKYNAYDHGLTANRLLDEKENMKYDFILHLLKEEFEISGYTEQILVERIAFYYIKIQKANEIEEKYSYFESILNILDRRKRVSEIEKKNGKPVDNLLKEAVEKQEEILEIHNVEDLMQIQRYTTTAENRLYKAIKELLKIKKLKNPDFHIIDIHF